MKRTCAMVGDAHRYLTHWIGSIPMHSPTGAGSGPFRKSTVGRVPRSGNRGGITFTNPLCGRGWRKRSGTPG